MLSYTAAAQPVVTGSTRMFARWMPRPYPIPESLVSGPFTTSMARDAGLPIKVLRGKRFRQLFRGVHAHAEADLTQIEWIQAARLAMPERAVLSHLTRIQALGLDLRPARPFHFTVVGDLHLARDDVFLHRTPRLPPTDAVGATPTAAFIGACSWERQIDIVKVGDWLLSQGHMTTSGLTELARHDSWRAGAAEAIKVSRVLDGRARSVRESETRILLIGAGLPAPEVNVPVLDSPNSPIVDLWWPDWRVCVEYEGSQHFTDRSQGLRDISRYADMRGADIAYVQVTSEMLRQPRALVQRVHSVLVSRGYAGPSPDFSARWEGLFKPMRPRPRWSAASGRAVA